MNIIVYGLLFVLMILTVHTKIHVYTKALMSFGFLFVLLQSSHQDYMWIMLPAILACLIGDVILAMRKEKYFLYGLGAFLAGNILFVYYFSHFQSIQVTTLILTMCIMLVFSLLEYVLKIEFKTLRIPVYMYAFMISFALSSSIMTYVMIETPMFLLSMIGFILYFISDIILLFHMFVKPSKVLGFCNLACYYAGMFLIVYRIF